MRKLVGSETSTELIRGPNDVQLEEAFSKRPVGQVTDLRAGGISAQHVQVDTRQDYTFSLESSAYSFGLNDLEILDGETRADDQIVQGGNWRGRMTFIPPGSSTTGWHQPAPRAQSFVVLYVDPAMLEPDLAKGLRPFTNPQLSSRTMRC